jgi:amino acid transporter
MGFNATWAMAVGGMVGGGIFSVLGVVISLTGAWAWLSFVIAGAIALVTGLSYVGLARLYGEGGGAFTFLREMDRDALAGGLSWVLLGGYVLTMSVYAATFGHYVGDVAGFPSWVGRALGGLVLLALMVVNLRGVGDASGVEIVTVWGKLAVLVLVAVLGLARWAPERLSPTGFDGGPGTALLAAASVFMAYEGFQLLTYDYEDIRDPERTLPRAVIASILAVIVIYVAVALGAAMLAGADELIAKQEIALAEAGRAALGLPGLIAVSVAAAFSTASAINATLFATARLARRVAADGELPGWLASRNEAGVPDRAVILLALATGVLLAVGSLRELVESASLAFLCTFAAVNAMAFFELAGRRRALAALGALGASAAAVTLVAKWVSSGQWTALIALGALLLLAFGARPLLLRAAPTED